MKILVSRTNKGNVSVEGRVVAAIERGLAVFIGLENDDTVEVFDSIIEKIINLRIFENENGKFDYSIIDKNYQILCIPNFTLCADTTKGRRPSFEQAMVPVEAKGLFNKFVDMIKEKNVKVEAGVFGAHMDIDLALDGPVNVIL